MLPLTLTYYLVHGHGCGNPGLLDRQIFVLVAYPTCKMFWNHRVFFRRIKRIVVAIIALVAESCEKSSVGRRSSRV
jgi:hypothetical protein